MVNKNTLFSIFPSMKTAVITGASSGIGLAITKKLLELDFKVFSVSRHPENCEFSHTNLHFEEGDLLDKGFMNQWVTQVRRDTGKHLDVLIHSAGFGLFKAIEHISIEDIERLTKIHLTIPMMLTRHFIHDLIASKGNIIALGSHAGTTTSRWGGPYAAAKAGLYHFMNGLFEDYRKQDLKVCTLIPDITATHFYDTLSFKPSDNPYAALNPEVIASIAIQVIQSEPGNVISEIRFRPQYLQLRKD
ncbi:SDR family oxidoreductase [bacterium]|nr:MAG: SDR family oxidoreductase [bacterium]